MGAAILLGASGEAYAQGSASVVQALEEAEHGDIARARMWLMRAARDGDAEPVEEAPPAPPAPIANPVAAPLEPVAVTADGKARA